MYFSASWLLKVLQLLVVVYIVAPWFVPMCAVTRVTNPAEGSRDRIVSQHGGSGTRGRPRYPTVDADRR